MQVLESQTIKMVLGSFELVTMDPFLLLSCMLNLYHHIFSRILVYPGWSLFFLGGKQEAKFRGVDRDESCVHFS